tara:strand:- start:6032 stop:7189 length:1158 start_codon:yes stop_codon:yes gene_type:complete
MEFKTELIFRLLVALFLIYVVGKIAATFIRGFFTDFFNGSGKNKIDIDQMIKKQVRILKEAQVAQGNDLNHENGLDEKGSKKFKTNTEKKYHMRLEKLKENSSKVDEKKDLEKVMVFFDNLQWGEGIFFNKIKEKMEKKFHTSTNLNEISRWSHTLLREELFLFKKDGKLLSINEIERLIENGLFLKKGFEEAKKRKGKLIGYLANSEGLQRIEILRGLEYFYLKNLKDFKSGGEEKLIPLLLKKDFIEKSNLEVLAQKKLDKITMNLLVNRKSDSIVPLSSYIKEISEYAHMFSCLNEIPKPKGGLDIKVALEMFNLSENCTLNEVKSVYKRLAKLKHPDRLSGLKIPEKYISLANHNFSNLQDAYKILTNFKKKDHSTKNQQG